MSENLQSASAQSRKPFQVTHKMVIGLALPMTLAYMTTPLLGLVDTGVVGRLGDPALIGGLAVGSVLIDLIFSTFNFLRSGTTGLTAQAFGREDEKEKQAILARALLIAFGAGLLAILATPFILKLSLYLMDPGGAVGEATRTYFYYRMIGAPLALANYVILGWMIGLGKSGLGLVLQILLNGTNIILSIFFGLYMGWGIAGVALGTVFGEAFAFIIGAILCWQMLDPAERPSKQRVFDRAALLRFANLNADIMLRSFLLIFAFAFFTAQSSRFGETTLAANAVLMNFFLIAGFFLDGLATAAEQIVGRAIGADFRPGFWQGFKLTMIWNAAMATGLFLILYLFGNHLIDMITTLQPVREIAYDFLPWAAMTALTGVVAFQMDGVYIGATWSRDMSVLMILSFIIYLLAWWLLRPLENTGLWMALHAFLITRGITLSLRIPFKVKQTFG